MFHEFVAERLFGVKPFPEKIDTVGQDGSKLPVEHRFGHVEASVHGLAHKVRVDERVVTDHEQLCGEIGCEHLHALRPVLVLFHVNHAKGARNQLFVGNGYMGS